jgi:mono/diheme cytochrome c family protein
MTSRPVIFLGFLLLLLWGIGCSEESPMTPNPSPDDALRTQGAQIFRFETFGDEVFWTDTLRMHEVIQNAVDPTTALSVGLKVDINNVPASLLASADLKSPQTTVELLRRDAVVGLKAKVSNGKITQVGITCALCHSTVDNSVMPGIGHRLDGYPNVDLDPGRIVALSPFFDDKPATRATLQSWGPGRYDAYWNHDGISDPVVIPPAFGLQNVALETYSGEGVISYWNAYVAVTQMHGQGSFSDTRLGIDIHHSPDLVTPKLSALLAYQLSLATPDPPTGSFDPMAAARGQAVFNGKAQCASCHIPPTFTDAGIKLHDPSETGMNALRASRGTTHQYRTTPLRGLWQHPPYFHDGSAATLRAVVDHYDTVLGLSLDEAQKADLIEYLKSL